MPSFMAAAAKTYPPVGKCIYCGTSKGKLSDEHIVPLGLGGKTILPEASCSVCADITSAIEGHCQGRMLGPLRIGLNYPTRHKKRRAKTPPIQLEVVDGKMG